MSETIPALKPSLLNPEGGETITSPAEWEARRDTMLRELVELQYGGMPPVPDSVKLDLLHAFEIDALGGATRAVYRITCTFPNGTVKFLLDVLKPTSIEKPPVVLCGDGCWLFSNDAVKQDVLGRGCALVRFNRTEIAADRYESERVDDLYRIEPEAMFGAVAAWAWGYHRSIDALEQLNELDTSCVAIIGHSRGGKTTLLKAFNGDFHTADMVQNIPYWLGPDWPQYVDNEDKLPFDQHVLLASIAPRPLITLEAEGDLWANPLGTRAVHAATQPVYDLYGQSDRLRLHTRPGGHDHNPDDWAAALDFFDAHRDSVR